MFGQEEVVVSAAIPYIRLSVYSMLPFMVFQSFRSWSDGIGNTKIAMVAIIIGNSANIVLNYIFIFGKLGFPEMGVTGAALSSLVSRIIMLLVWFLVIRNKESFTSTLKSLTLEKVDKTMLIRLLGLGFIMALQMFFEVLMFTASTLMMGVLGEVQQAAHQIALNIITITFMVTTGFSVAATIRVGHYLGKKEIAELKPAGNTSIILSGIFMFCSGIFMILFRDFLPSLYIQEIDVIQYASSMLIFAAIFQIPDGIQISSIGALRGLQDVKIPTLLTFISYGVFGIPIALLLCFTFDLGFKGVWIGLIVGLLINAVVTTIRFNQQSAKRISSQFF
jgi:MATE family multidrug resistance protein